MTKAYRAFRERKPTAKMRMEVLKRDKFRCVLCGRSPLTDPNIKLHVDHWEPFSKGGLTDTENLKTLCMECNIGKGDSIIEL